MIDHKREYDRQRYLEKLKPIRFQDKRCRCCEILLKSRYGARYSREYCRRCIELGAAKRDLNRRHYKANRSKILAAEKRRRMAHQHENIHHQTLHQSSRLVPQATSGPS